MAIKIKTIKILGNSIWKSDTKSLITIYKAFSLSSIDYEDIIYNSATKKDLNTLDPLHNQGYTFSHRSLQDESF